MAVKESLKESVDWVKVSKTCVWMGSGAVQRKELLSELTNYFHCIDAEIGVNLYPHPMCTVTRCWAVRRTTWCYQLPSINSVLYISINTMSCVGVQRLTKYQRWSLLKKGKSQSYKMVSSYPYLWQKEFSIIIDLLYCPDWLSPRLLDRL